MAESKNPFVPLPQPAVRHKAQVSSAAAKVRATRSCELTAQAKVRSFPPWAVLEASGAIMLS